MPLLGAFLLIALGLPVGVYLVRRRAIAGTAVHCASCGIVLSAAERLLGRSQCRAHLAASNAERNQARARYLGALTAFDITAPLTPLEEGILADTTAETLGSRWHERVAVSAVKYVFEQALADDILTPQEEATIVRLASMARTTVPDVLRSEPGLASHAIAARVNSGRLPVVRSPSSRLRRGEVCYFEAEADLMTDGAGAAVVSSRGVATAKGDRIAYSRLVRTLVPMSSERRAWDHGTLVITDRRVFFEGSGVSIQVPHRRLNGFTLFRDGLQVHISDRRAEPVFRVGDPLAVAAIAGGAAPKSSTQRVPRVQPLVALGDMPVISVGSA